MVQVLVFPTMVAPLMPCFLAAEHSFDVVLIDTAGRMQDNEVIMHNVSIVVLVDDANLTSL